MKHSKIQVINEVIKNKSFLSKIPHIFRMFNAWRKGTYKADFMDMIIPLAGIIYIISPIDLIPGFAVPFVGALDDLMILSLILPRLTKEIDKFLSWESDKKNDITKTIDVTSI